MTEGRSSFEVGISRHAPKMEAPKGPEGFDTGRAEIDREQAEGQAEAVARRMTEELEAAPPGTVMAIEPSNIMRAEQTRSLLLEKLSDALAGRPDIELRELGNKPEEAEASLADIRSNPDKKYVITDLRGTWLLGFKETDEHIAGINAWQEQLQGNENFLGKLWAARPEELEQVSAELQAAGIEIAPGKLRPADFRQTPESQALRQLRWMEAMRRIGQERLPGRPLRLEGVSHNLRSDYATLALLGHDISVASINEFLGGKFREPFERSSVRFDEDGIAHVEYRDMKKDYTPEEFAQLEAGLRARSKARLEEWGIETEQS